MVGQLRMVAQLRGATRDPSRCCRRPMTGLGLEVLGPSEFAAVARVARGGRHRLVRGMP